MTISNTTASITHLGNGVNTLWVYGFKIPDTSSVVVTVIDAGAVETVLDAATFSISGIGSDSGGTVTYPLTGSPLASGYSIRIDRSVALTQTTGFSNQSGLINSLIESAFDKLTMIAQDTRSTSVRAITASQAVLAYVNTAAGYAAAAAASAAAAAEVAAGNAVLFIAQTLTPAQKAQVRTNSDSAVSGVNDDITSLTGLTTAISIAQGGTGATTAATARTNLELGSAATLNADNTANNLVKLDATGAIPAGVRVAPALHLQHQLASGTDGGTITRNAWTTRAINTVVRNDISGASLASNQITLPAGTYRVFAAQEFKDLSTHVKPRLRNITAGSTLLTGMNADSSSAWNTSNPYVVGVFTLSATTVVELQYYTTSTAATAYNLGQASSSGEPEVYVDALFERLA